MGSDAVGAAELMAARVLQLVSDLSAKPMTEVRVLDLACLEGLYGLEFAARGASVLALEGRESSAEKAAYAARELGLDRYEVRVEDVRDLSLERHGRFDVVLCMGILYHLEAMDAFKLAETVAAVTEGLAIVRTAVGLTGRRVEEHGGRTYRGYTMPEGTSPWASIGNDTSFLPTRSSLLNLLLDAGFTSVLDVAAPAIPEVDLIEDSVMLACLKGAPVDVRVAPAGTSERLRSERLVENMRINPSHVQRRGSGLPIVGPWISRRFWSRTMARR
jgi:SAM-dependent methyltransferase